MRRTVLALVLATIGALLLANAHVQTRGGSASGAVGAGESSHSFVSQLGTTSVGSDDSVPHSAKHPDVVQAIVPSPVAGEKPEQPPVARAAPHGVPADCPYLARAP